MEFEPGVEDTSARRFDIAEKRVLLFESELEPDSRAIGADSSCAIRIDVTRKMSVGSCCWINIDRCRYVDAAVIRVYVRLLYLLH